MKTIVKKQVWKEILEVGEGLSKPGKPYIVTVELKGWLEGGEVFLETKTVDLVLGDTTLPGGLWRSI